MNRLFLVLFLLSFTISSFAQYRARKEPDKNLAKDNFSMGNFDAALVEYRLLNKNDADNPLYNYRLGVCYLKVHGDKTMAVQHLEFAVRNDDFKSKAYYDLAFAYMHAERYSEAENAWKKYKELNPNLSSDELKFVDRQIEITYQARELMKYPLAISFENAGDDVNSEFPDYYPFVTEDESQLVYTSRRKGTMGGYQTYDGFYTSDIFISYERSGKWGRARGAGSQVNSSGDDEAVSFSSDGQHLFIYSENEFDYGDIHYAPRKNRGFLSRSLLDENVNTAFLEVAATISPDGNYLVFSSDKSEGQGELDLYVARKLPNGHWGVPVNLGPQVNSPYNEDFPMFSPDGKLLYFSSQGHISMGGFDLFRSEFNAADLSFSRAENLGYPLNSADDNMTISFSGSKRYAYVSAWRPDSHGSLDIYRVSFEQHDRELTALIGKVFIKKPIDFNTRKKIKYYTRNGVKAAFPEKFVPPSDWVLAGEDVLVIKEGIDHKFLLTFSQNGESLTFDETSLPEDLTGFEFKQIKVLERPVKGFVPPPANRPQFTTEPVATAFLTLFNKATGEMYGTYQTIGESGKYVIIAPPGNYSLEVEVPDSPIFTEEITILDKGSYQQEIKKDVILEYQTPKSSK